MLFSESTEKTELRSRSLVRQKVKAQTFPRREAKSSKEKRKETFSWFSNYKREQWNSVQNGLNSVWALRKTSGKLAVTFFLFYFVRQNAFDFSFERNKRTRKATGIDLNSTLLGAFVIKYLVMISKSAVDLRWILNEKFSFVDRLGFEIRIECFTFVQWTFSQRQSRLLLLFFDFFVKIVDFIFAQIRWTSLDQRSFIAVIVVVRSR